MAMTTSQPPPPEVQPQLSPCEARERMAASGDVDGLWQLLCTTPGLLLNQEAAFRLLLRALETQCREDPARFSAAVFAKMVSFTTYLLYRTHFFLHALVPGEPSLMGCDGRYFSKDVVEVLIPQLMALQGHLSEIVQSQATTARNWQLTRRKKQENDRARRRTRRTSPGPSSPKDVRVALKPSGEANGAPTNRLASVLSESLRNLHHLERDHEDAG